MNRNKPADINYVKNRTGPKPDSKKPIKQNKPKTRSK